MTITRRLRTLSLVAAGALSWVACGENRSGTGRMSDTGDRPPMVQQIPLVPGLPVQAALTVNPFEDDTVALAEGERLYGWFNCSGCHFGGGGGIGPPLMDRAWIYGSEPDQIFDSIASGRANGMPAYGTRITVDQIWKIALFVESLEAAAEAEGDEVASR